MIQDWQYTTSILGIVYQTNEVLGRECGFRACIRKNIRATEAAVPRWREFTSQTRVKFV